MVDDAGNPGGGRGGADASGPTPGSGLICPQCGVVVAPGYPKCPKCHGKLPHVPSPLYRGGTQVSGGTTAAAGGGAGVWLVAVAIVAIAGAVAIFATRGGGGGEQAPAEEQGEGVEDTDEVEAPDEDDELAVEPAAPASAADAAGEVGDTELLEELNTSLAAARVWSSVDEDGADDTVVRIVSSHCDDPSLRRAIEPLAPRLKVAGYQSVRCYSQHGALDYERKLQ